MTRGTRIAAVETEEPQGLPVSEATDIGDEAQASPADDWWVEPPARPRRPWGAILAGTATVAAIGAWSALFFLANQAEILAGGSVAQWTAWIRDWSVPVLLVALLWLLAMRNSRREAHRFGETAQLLGAESARLEARLTTVNRELSLAREFIAAQARDFESIGRVATERLSQHADKLSSLIQDNGTRLDQIQTVSASALENMETLRGHLPVIASSAKDVTNNIGNAGRTAHAQVEDLVSGFNRLNEFGVASEKQVKSLREVVENTLAEFNRQMVQLDVIADQRFGALSERGAEFRTQLDNHEIEALAAIRSRANSLGEELQQARSTLDAQEGASLESLRSRLTAVRDESAAIGRSLREGEGNALEAWRGAIGRLEDDLTAAIAKVGEIDEKAMASARNRLAELGREAEEVDSRMAERDRVFAEELERRLADFDARHGEFVARIDTQLAELDGRIAERRESHEAQGRELLRQGETVTAQMALLAGKLQDAAAQGSEAEGRIAASLEVLAEKLVASRNALTGTDTAVAKLTDSSVRLLELIQASVQHSTTDLPDAMGVSEASLQQIETRVSTLKSQLDEVEASGERVAGHVGQSTASLAEALTGLETLGTRLSEGGASQLATLDTMRASLETVRSECLGLAEQAQGELKSSIEDLNQSAKAAVSGIEAMSAAQISALAARLGEESGAAIDQAMRSRAAEVAGQLEQAASHAAGVSREAAVQLRDQLAKVGELASHLERRVAHARARAEEQVYNDFARRVALITESLNSNAIDIARAMDSEVTDTAWAAYLKGDRGIFTRRAVRLLDAPEAKAVAQIYERDPAFRDHVSRYIHDFEAMLRQLLSTRDGHALGVTLLSSDMGKLYVALAQAIERLRN
ncbi:MAG: ATPase [Novosphingobium sp.]